MLPKACDCRFVLFSDHRRFKKNMPITPGRDFQRSNWPHLLVELGVEKRSITGTELTVPPAVETGDESVVAIAGFLWSSFRRCS